jgi:hypothetical protein
MTSTFYGGAQDQIQERFGVSRPIVTLGTGLVNLVRFLPDFVPSFVYVCRVC